MPEPIDGDPRNELSLVFLAPRSFALLTDLCYLVLAEAKDENSSQELFEMPESLRN